MNYDMKRLDTDEVEIDIKSIVVRCVEKIKLILILGLICALVLPSLIYMKDLSDYNKEDVQKVELSAQDQLVVDEYLLLLGRKVQMEAFLNESLFMQLDFNETYKAKMQYYFISENDAGYDFACAIKNYLQNGAFSEAVNNKLGNDELLVNNDMLAASTYEGSGIFNVEILAATEEDCKNYAEILNNLIIKYTEEIRQKYNGCRVEIIQKDIVCEYSWSVYNGQKEYLQTYKNIVEDISKRETELNESQKMYVSIMDNEGFEEDEVQAISAPKWNIKYAILGGILGSIAATGVIVLFVLFGGRIQSTEEIQKRLQIANLGCVNSKKDADDMIVARVKTLCAKQNVNRMRLISSNGIKEEQIRKLVEKINHEGIACDILGNILGENEALEKLAQEENVIFVETIGKTKVKDLYKEATICKEMKVKVLGYIIL